MWNTMRTNTSLHTPGIATIIIPGAITTVPNGRNRTSTQTTGMNTGTSRLTSKLLTTAITKLLTATTSTSLASTKITTAAAGTTMAATVTETNTVSNHMATATRTATSMSASLATNLMAMPTTARETTTATAMVKTSITLPVSTAPAMTPTSGTMKITKTSMIPSHTATRELLMAQVQIMAKTGMMKKAHHIPPGTTRVQAHHTALAGARLMEGQVRQQLRTRAQVATGYLQETPVLIAVQTGKLIKITTTQYGKATHK